MNQHEDSLIEIHTEELPPKSLLSLMHAFKNEIGLLLEKNKLNYQSIQTYATPRRLAVLIHQLTYEQPEQIIEKKGPAVNAAYSSNGKPTPACLGFAKANDIAVDELIIIKQNQNEWVGCRKKMAGENILTLLPTILQQAIDHLPIPKRMAWHESKIYFSRPVHSVMLLYGNKIIDATILGQKTSNKTRGHRFLAPDWMTIPHANQYEALLNKAFVIANFEERKTRIQTLANNAISSIKEKQIHVHQDEDLLNEVTGLVEWPVALIGTFDKAFLNLPKEVLICSMQDHQRYFPLEHPSGELVSHFLLISNIENKDPSHIIKGNERVLRARLSDAAFFYQTDKNYALLARVERLKGIIFQAKLGTLYAKAERLGKLSAEIASETKENEQQAERAGFLAKCDLTTNMVGEFPELQGTMGYYYALHDGESNDVALAIRDHYHPRFAGDTLPETKIGKIIALADRLDTLVGTFGINLLPTGDKDPYGLRRAALGIVRLLVEGELFLDLRELLKKTYHHYQLSFENKNTIEQVLQFILERMRFWYADHDVSSDIFAAVVSIDNMNLLDMDARIQAVRAFKNLQEATALCLANKRVSNILAQYKEPISAESILPNHLEHIAEKNLIQELDIKFEQIKKLANHAQYQAILFQLAELSQPIDAFFDQVMVMVDDKAQRENRLLILKKIRHLFLQVADIALLQ